MKGPAVLLLSLAGAVAFGMTVALPAWREASVLEGRLRDRPAAAAAALETRADQSAARLLGSIGGPRPAALDRLRGIALGFAPLTDIREDRDAGEISLVVAWSALPRLLSRLAADRRLAFALIEATETGQPERSRVRIRLEPAPQGS